MIRFWQVEDNASVCEIEKECFKDAWNLPMIFGLTSRRDFIGFVYEKNGKIQAYVGGTFCYDTGEICLVAVKEEYRRQGIANSLVLEMLNGLKEKGVDKVFLEVRKSNVPAKNCYEKIGFKVIGERPKYYSDGEDAFVMEKVL